MDGGNSNHYKLWSYFGCTPVISNFKWIEVLVSYQKKKKKAMIEKEREKRGWDETEILISKTKSIPFWESILPLKQ